MTHTRALSQHRVLFRAAFSLAGLFAWVIVFKLFSLATPSVEVALAGAVALYVCSHVLTFVLTPIAGAALRAGVRRVLVFGTLLAAISFAILEALFIAYPTPQEVYWSLAAFALAQGVYRAFYFLPYAAEKGKHRGTLPLVSEMVFAFLPAIGGYVLAHPAGGAAVLFFFASAIIVVSAVRILRAPAIFERYDWSYRTTLAELGAHKNHQAVGLFILDGVQGAVLLFLWPLAIFLIVDSFVVLGALLTATLSVAFLGRFLVKKVLASLRVESPVVLATIVFSTWMTKLIAASPVQLLAVNIAYTSGSSPARFSVDSYANEQSADGGHYIDEYTAIKEMGLAIGRCAVGLLFIVLVLTTAESVAFVATILTAAIAGAWSVIIAHRLQKVAY